MADEPLRIYIFEHDPAVGDELFDQLLDPKLERRYIISGIAEFVPTDGQKPPEADVIIYDPEVDTGGLAVDHSILRVMRAFMPQRIEIIVHADDWALQTLRDEYKGVAVRYGFVRKRYRSLLNLLEKIRADRDAATS